MAQRIDHLQRLNEELELMSEDQLVISVSRKDLEKLIAEVESNRKAAAVTK